MSRLRFVMFHLGGHRGEAIAIFLLALLTAVAPFLVFVWLAIGDTKSAIEDERLRMTQIMARQADRLMSEAFLEIELVAALVSLDSEPQELSRFSGVTASFSAGVVVLGSDGKVLLADPPAAKAGLDRGRATEALASAAAVRKHGISEPFVSPATGRPTVALSVPVYDELGMSRGAVVGLVDLTEPLLSDLVDPARLLRPTGHADVVDERGLVVVSTEPELIMTEGDHPDFYRRMAKERSAVVEKVSHEPDEDSQDQSRSHLMAYVPLSSVPWGLSMGASDADVFGAPNTLRRTLLVLGATAIAVLAAGAALMVRRIPTGSDKGGGE